MFVVLMSFYVVVSRLHYSVDVMLAWFLVPMVWLSWNSVSGPSIFEEEEEEDIFKEGSKKNE